MTNNKVENAHSAIDNYIKNYKFYEEGSLLDAYLKQIDNHGLSSIFMPNEDIHNFLRELGFFSPAEKTGFISNREQYVAPGLQGRKKVY